MWRKQRADVFQLTIYSDSKVHSDWMRILDEILNVSMYFSIFFFYLFYVAVIFYYFKLEAKQAQLKDIWNAVWAIDRQRA